MSENDPLWNTTGLFAIGGFFLTALALPDWIHFQWPAINATILGCMLFSIFGSTLLAYYLNLWALSRTKSSSVALFIYVQPVVASLLAWVAFGEIITLRTILSSLLIFSGMLLALAR